MKISDVGLFQTNQGICICRKNSRGLPQTGGIDVTTQVLDMFVAMFKSEPDKQFVYTGKDYYTVNVTKMTDDEKADYIDKRAKKGEKAFNQLTIASEILANAFARSQNRGIDLVNPPKRKDGSDDILKPSKFDCIMYTPLADEEIVDVVCNGDEKQAVCNDCKRMIRGEHIWKKYFKAPFKNDGMGCYLFDKDNQMTIEFEDDIDEDIIQMIEDILNDKPIDKYNKIVAEIIVSGCDVSFNDIPVFCVRGWGYLTGSLKLKSHTACKIQDSMLKYIIDKLKGE